MFRPYEGKAFAMAKKKDTPVRLDQLTEEEMKKYMEEYNGKDAK